MSMPATVSVHLNYVHTNFSVNFGKSFKMVQDFMICPLNFDGAREQ